MGFPVGYSEVPKLVLHLLFLLSHIRRLSSCLLRLTGLDVEHDDLQHQYYQEAAAADRLEEHSPAVRFDSLSSSARDQLSCAVCLGDFHGAAEVRRARGCLHVFHRGCLDRWAAHGRHTCPLCRSPLLPPLLLPSAAS